ncbi:MAG: hypothetical protein LQ349_005688 [Xanthoria aureola]|nr:MAG: hypothetical protein LQ349_005688 [Xanthoria aureola]
MSDNDFPTLQPAMTILVHLGGEIMGVGSASKGTPLNIAPMTGGTAVSYPEFSPSIDAVLDSRGNDYIRNDPDGKHMRLDAHTVLKDKNSGSLVYAHYTGVVDITPELGAILSGKEDAKSTDFGDSFVHFTFETGDEKLKALENGVFVGAGRFVVEKERPITVEYRISKVVM